MTHPRNVLTPEALAMLHTIVERGSFAAAARALGLVPSALTYRVRQIEDALDVLLFDRQSRQARITEAGRELLREGERLLHEIDTIANRVKRVATGWEPQLTVAVDTVIARSTVMDLCDAFLALKPPTRLRLREETLSGTLLALTTGQADIALGVVLDPATHAGIYSKPLGALNMVYAVAPQHPLAQATEPLTDAQIRQHRGIAVADSAPSGQRLTFGLLSGQDVFTVNSMSAKLDAQLRGLGGGYLAEYLARPYVASGQLLSRQVQRQRRQIQLSYAWRQDHAGHALHWWLAQLENPVTRHALLGQGVDAPAPQTRPARVQ